MPTARVPVRRQFVRTLLVAALTAALLGLAQTAAHAVAPQAFPGSLTTAVDQAANVDLTGSVQDVDGGPRTFIVVTGPTHGALTPCGTGLCQYTPAPGYTGPDSFTWKVNDGTADSNTVAFSITVTSDPNGPAITSAGPLTNLQISATLNCLVDRAGDTFGAFYQDNACGTLAVLDGVLYTPATLPGAPAATPFTPVAQSAVTGAGTAASPYSLVTTVGLGATGVQLVQTDTYVVGQETYRTDIEVKNTSQTQRTVRLYRAGDCQLGDDSANPELAHGTGSIGPAGAVACTRGTRLLQFSPLSAGSHYLEDSYDQVWNKIATKAAFPDTCRCTDTIDNGAGLQWDVVVPAASTATRSSVFTVSPTGAIPLRTSSSVTPASVPGGAAVTYTVTVANPGATSATVTEIADTLPPGFTYQAGSTTGATTVEPTNVGGVLRWALTSNNAVAANASLALSFTAITPTAGGTFSHSATATATGRYVVASGPSAPVTVTAPNTAPVANDDAVSTAVNTAVIVNVRSNDSDANGDTLTVGAKTEATTHGDVTCSTTTCTYTPDPGYVGGDSFTYTISDGRGGSDIATVTVTVTAVNHAPDAVNDTLSTTVNTGAAKAVLLNDTDADGDTLTVTGKTDGTHGDVTCTTSTCTYTPDPGYVGGDAFTYTISDGRGGSDTATVSVTVTSSDLSVAASPFAPAVAVGTLTGYTITVHNGGTVASTTATVRSSFPAGFRVRDVSAPGCAALGGAGCSLSPIGPGGTVQIRVRGAFTRHGDLPHLVTVTSVGDSLVDNDTAVALTKVVGSDCTKVGTFGNDRLIGTNGRDILCGLAGNDTLSPMLGNDVVYGNEGTDTVTYAAVVRAVRVLLGNRTASGQGADILSSVENATGSARADVLTGDGLANVLSGLGGNDVINGGPGNDRLLGGAGADRLSGGAGNDTLNGGPGPDTCGQGPGTGPRISC